MMKTDQIIFKENKLELLVKRPSHFVTIFMLSSATFCVIFPVIIFINLLIESSEGFPIRLMTLVFLSIPFIFGIYLFRLFLWNFFGKEVYVFQNGKINFHTDFKYFKDSKKEIDCEDSGFGWVSSGYENEKKAVLTIKTSGKQHKSSVEIAEKDLIELTELLNKKTDLINY